MKGNGFDRLRSAAIMGVMGLGSLAGGTARAAVTNLPLALTITSGTRTYKWGTSPSTNTAGETTSGIGNLTWCRNPAVTASYVSSTGFCLAEAEMTVGTDNQSDWIDSAFGVAVDGVMFANPDGTVDLTGDTVTTDTAAVSGVDAKVEMAFSVGRPGVLRVLYSFTNDTASPVTKSIAIGGNLGSDGSTTAQWSADGDATIEATDGWYISSDNVMVGGDTGSDPIFTLARFETGADVIPVGVVPGGGDDNFSEIFDLDIPANSTRRILIFAEMSQTLTEAKASAASFNTAAAMSGEGLFSGLSNTERAEVVNFNVPAKSGGGGSLDPASLMTLGGLLALIGLRRRRKTEN
jgi:hypothetical protein